MAKAPAKRTKATASAMDVTAVLAWLQDHGERSVREQMGPRFGIWVEGAYGVRMSTLQRLVKVIGTDHGLAAKLWATGQYEARMVACMIDDPTRVTPAQMDRWCKDFDNWGIVDTVCFKLFDQVPHAYAKVAPWSKRKPEFEKRGGVVLLACLALHDRDADDAAFLQHLPLMEQCALDDRNFVKKGVSWALRAIGGRNARLRKEVQACCERLIATGDPAARWVGRDVARQLKPRTKSKD